MVYRRSTSKKGSVNKRSPKTKNPLNKGSPKKQNCTKQEVTQNQNCTKQEVTKKQNWTFITEVYAWGQTHVPAHTASCRVRLAARTRRFERKESLNTLSSSWVLTLRATIDLVNKPTSCSHCSEDSYGPKDTVLLVWLLRLTRARNIPFDGKHLARNGWSDLNESLPLWVFATSCRHWNNSLNCLSKPSTLQSAIVLVRAGSWSPHLTLNLQRCLSCYS